MLTWEAWKSRKRKRDGKNLSITYLSEHQTWCNMIKRCYNPSAKDYPRYGLKGISVCKRWYTSFANFIRDMGPKPTLRHSIDRINGKRGYSPKNCRWATSEEQSRNRSFRKYMTYRGKTRLLSDWAKELGISYATFWNRIRRGTPLDCIFSSKLLKSGPKPKGVKK